MRIGIYKVGPKIFFGKNKDDHSAISIEVTRVARILAKGGHQVHILSDNDYIPSSIENVSSEVPEGLDKAFIYNGVGDYLEGIAFLTKLTHNINLIVTDLALLPDAHVMSLFTNIYTQSPNFHTYGHIQEHECFEYEPFEHINNARFYFGGTERGRSKDFFEYVYRPDAIWYGKSETLGVRRYIPYDEHKEMMSYTKYSIVIGDEAYNKIGFVTPRYYECIRHDVIAFVDSKYDPDELMIKKDDFRRVSDYAELYKKMEYLDANPDIYFDLLEKQRAEITQELKEGQNILKALIS